MRLLGSENCTWYNNDEKIFVCVGNQKPVARARGSYRVQYGAGIMLISFEGCIMSTYGDDHCWERDRCAWARFYGK
jgi:hypothetical protein